MRRNDRRGSRIGTLWLAALLVTMSCVPNAPVVQGKVLSVDAGGKVIAVQDEAMPDGAPILIDISQAEIGAPPVPGDLVRLAYRVDGGRNTALRVMNLTHQKDRGN
jgi:hypothetical protein